MHGVPLATFVGLFKTVLEIKWVWDGGWKGIIMPFCKILSVACELQLLLPVGMEAVGCQSREGTALSNMMLKQFANAFTEMFVQFSFLQS